MVTGKNKEQFEKWYYDDQNPKYLFLHEFYNTDFEMQIGVLLNYYDSLGVYITIDSINSSSH